MISRQRVVRVAVAIAVVGAAAAGLMRFNPPPRRLPNILIVVIDSLRADRVGAYGSTRGLTPLLDQLAAQSLVYERAYAPSSWTVPTVASLFLGRYPSQHQITLFDAAIPKSETTLAKVLADHGYATSGFSANGAIRSDNGFANGFERYAVVGEMSFAMPKSDGAEINAAALRRVDEVGSARPHCMYLHYMEPHVPYRAHPWTPPRPAGLTRTDAELNLAITLGAMETDADQRADFWKFSQPELDRLQALYDGEVRYADQMLSDLLAGLAVRGFLDDSIVVVTADHGEEFGEHGLYNHGVSLFEAVIRVPLLIRRSGEAPARLATAVDTAGLAARVFAWLDIDRPARFAAAPIPTTVGEGDHAFSELLKTKRYQLWLHRYALIRGDSKLVIMSNGETREYMVANGTDEYRSSTAQPDLLAALTTMRSELETDRTEAGRAQLDPATIERLRGLGYAPASE